MDPQICPTCNQTFTDRTALLAHVGAAHGSGSQSGELADDVGAESRRPVLPRIVAAAVVLGIVAAAAYTMLGG